ncbi:MAG: sulfite exporter TauE/SafE family protein [Lachnospiraceae bacterium]|nr:sulfite exporter TauE/SafE family protein [Lachnospiraceae bacterium]
MSEPMIFLLLIIICIGGGFIQRVSGFGMSIFVMLFLPYLMPSYNDATATTGLIFCILTVFNAIVHYKHTQLKLVLPLLIAAMITIPIAVRISSVSSGTLMKKLLGVMLVAFSIYFLFFSKKIHIRPTVANGLFAGALGGALTGMFSTGGPPVVLYLIHATSDKMVYFSTIQSYFALASIYSSGVRLINGMITWEIVIFAAAGLIGCAIGTRLGTKFFDRLSAEKLKQVIYVGMIISGVLMIV